jgi:hypothetical protein
MIHAEGSFSDDQLAQKINGFVGVKHDNDKIDLSFLEFEMMENICRVFEYGQHIYSRDNWKSLPDGTERFKKAALRHILKSNTELLDSESQLPHVYHVIVSLLMSEWHRKE